MEFILSLFRKLDYENFKKQHLRIHCFIAAIFVVNDIFSEIVLRNTAY